MTLPRPQANVLIVDDEEAIRRLVGVLLTRFVPTMDIHVTEAASAEEALTTLEFADFDLVVSDHSMPGKNGVDVLQHAREHTPRAARVMITAHGELDIGVDAINRGKVDGFLRKPWDNDAFVALSTDLLAPRARILTERDIRPEERAAVEGEMGELDRHLQQLRVRLGLGSLSPEGYHRLAAEISKRRTALELALLQSRRG